MLKTDLCGIRLNNPTVLASGILGVSKESINRVGREGAGAVTLKSLCHEERKGHPCPSILAFDDFMLNAVGLPGQGIDNAIDDFKALDDCTVPVIASIYGYTEEQFGEVAKKASLLKPAMLEVNISCPHMKSFAKPFYADIESIKAITKIVKQNSNGIPVSIKLSPNVHNIAELAKAAESAGADAITAVNTLFGMAIDLETHTPVLGNKTGGVSGPAIKHLAIKCVYDIYKAVKIPIIGTGGITTGKDAIEMLMAGATAVGIGTAIYYRGTGVFNQICKEMEEWLRVHNYTSLSQIRGIAHE